MIQYIQNLDIILREFLVPLGWFLRLGEKDTQHLKEDIAHLLHHTTQSLKSYVRLTELLYSVKHKNFEKRFPKLYFDYKAEFTGPENLRKVRTHCTDIQRDLRRIRTKVTTLLRVDLYNPISPIARKVVRGESKVVRAGGWKGITAAFQKLAWADETFLRAYGKALQTIGRRLRGIFELLESGKEDKAWHKFEELRTAVFKSHKHLEGVLLKMDEAEDHVRDILT
jgi:hypothetical protein